MNGLLAWFARNGVAANLMMGLILLGGLLGLGSVRREVYPEFSQDRISVAVEYLGAAPEEVEEAICARIEERVLDLETVKEVRSVASEGIGRVTLEFLPGTDIRQALDDVKTRIDAIDSFPAEAEEPVIQEIFPRLQVLSIAISGPASELTLRHLGEQVRDEILAIPGVTLVELTASRPYEISIEVSEAALRRHGLTFERVAEAVRRSSVDLPGGSVRTRSGEILLRTEGQAYRGREFERLVLLTRPDGTRLTLGDVAQVIDGFAETDLTARFEDQPAVLVDVYRVGEQDVNEIAERVKAYVAEAQIRMPEGIRLTVWQDSTRLLRGRIDTLVRNGRAGLLLVLLALALFVRLRVAVWVAVGIPVAFFGTLWLMPALDVAISVISLFAFVVVLGIVVDDAIVVGENIYRHHQMGKTGLEAAIAGVQQVAVPVVFSVLTTIAAFAPLTAVPGTLGKVARVIPVIIICTLVFSLVESLLILPAHLSHLRPKRAGVWGRFQGRLMALFDRLNRDFYRPLLERALVWRYTTVAIAVAILLLTFGTVAGGRIKFTFFPSIEAENVVAFLTMPKGTAPEVTARVLQRLEDSARQVALEIADAGEPDAIRHVMATVGNHPYRSTQSRGRVSTLSSGHLGEVNMELAAAEDRDVSAEDLARRWRQLAGPIPDAVELSFSSDLLSSGKAIDVELSAPDLEVLRRAAGELKEALARYPGVQDVSDSFRLGKRQIKLAITPEAESLGLTLSDLGRQVRQAFYGEEVQRIQRGREELKVMVRYPQSERRSLESLERMRVRLPGGGEMPFSVAGRTELGRGFSQIDRVDGRRIVNVTADVDSKRANSGEIRSDLQRNVLPGLMADHRGLRASFAGQQQSQQEALAALRRGFALALFVIFALLAIPFRSYWQPLIIMSGIPFGIIGAFWGHALMGKSLTALSLFGIVAVTGVVVNDGLVMIDFVNRARHAGASLFDAIREAGVKRFRPIVLTSLTTFAGLTPLLLEKSVEAQFLIPMVISIAFGVLFATVITLILVPVSYTILEDFRALGRRLFRDGKVRREAAAAG